MKSLIINSSKKILKFIPETHYQETIQEDRGVYFGICKSFNKIFCLARNSDKSNSETIEVFDEKDLTHLGSFKINIEDGHQIEAFAGLLLITNTGKDSIDIYNHLFEFKTAFRPFQTKKHHINSVKCLNDKLFLVCHRDENGEESGPIIAFDIKSMRELARFNIGRHAHDIFFDGDHILCTASRDGEIVRLDKDLKLLQRKKVCPSPLLRGIARIGNDIYVAQSQEGERQTRHSSQNGYIYKLDKDLEQKEVFEIQECGQINDMVSHDHED